MLPNRINFVVIDENVLGYVQPESPNVVGMLSSSHCINGPIAMPMNLDRVRPARRKDFDKFRVMFNGYKNNPQHYNFLS